jgi:hypothetical protein
MLRRTGNATRAEALLRRLEPGDTYGVPNAMMLFHLACSEIDKGAAWAERAIQQRDPVAVIHLLGPDTHVWRSSSGWPTLSKMMNLPGAVA